jgi:uncharacterized protein (UPF0332 family)
MKKRAFLKKLYKEEKLELVEPSLEMSASYFEKADNCLKSAKLLLSNSLYENSITMSYYGMYNSLLALLFSVGIKSENHAASIFLLDKLFYEQELYAMISAAKEERIDKQYYVPSENESIATKESSEALLKDTERFIIQIKLKQKMITSEDREKLRKQFLLLV